MGITKTDLFSLEQNAMAHMAKVLGHPARIAILEYLVKSNSCINGDLVQELGLAQATISQHLRELKEVGFIQGAIALIQKNGLNLANYSVYFLTIIMF
jgi:predicted transcriptional regulator